MKHFLLASTGLLALAFTAQPAAAADMPRPVMKAPAMVAAPMFNWTGCYAGVSGGGAWGKSRHTDEDGEHITKKFDVDGWLVGGTLGCNVQSAAWVFGLEGDWSWSDKEGGGRAIGSFNPDFVSRTEEKWLATLRGRVGWANGQWLPYLTAGVAAADVEIHVFDTTDPSSSARESKTRWGWTVGAGVEVAFAPNWSAKLEYLYVDFNDKGYFSPSPDCCSERGDVELNNHIVRVGLNYRFATGKMPVGKMPAAGPVVTKY